MRRTLFVLILLAGAPNLLAATRTWSGAVDTNWSTPGNWIGGVAPSPGDDLVFPASGANQASDINDFPAGTIFSSIAFTGGLYVLQGNAIALGASGMQQAAGNTDFLSLPITLAAAQRWTSGGSLFVNGAVDLNGMALTLAGSFILFDGVISGAGSITGQADNVNIDGTCSTSAPFSIDNEFLNVAGTYLGPIMIGADGSLGVGPGGTVGKVTSTGGASGGFSEFMPGVGAPADGVANTGDIDLHAGGTLEIVLAGPTNFGSASVAGTVNITNASLILNVNSSIPAGTTFTLIDNDGTDPIIGTFTGIPEGAEIITILSPRQIFKVSYAGGSGNDLVVTAEGAATLTTTKVTTSSNPAVPTQAVTFTATVTAKSGTATPAGSVNFFDATTTPQLLLGSAPLDSSGTARFTTSSLSVGTHTIVANYPDNAPFSRSGASVSQQVVPAPVPALDPRVLAMLAIALAAIGFLLANHD